VGSRSLADLLESPRAPVFCLAVAAVASAALLLSLDSHLTFVNDDWSVLLDRRGWSPGTFLAPFHEHIILALVVIYRVLLGIFGMGSALPFLVTSTAVFLLSVVLLFVYVRRRLGGWAALIAAILILFLGAAFEDLLWAAGIVNFGAVAAGLGALLALDRDDTRGDRIACALLVVSLAFSILGLAFVAGTVVELILNRRPQRQRAYVALAPIGAFAVWWLGWGHNAESHFSAHNVVHAPAYVFDAAAAGITSLLGLAGGYSGARAPHLDVGRAALAGILALAVWRLARGARPSKGMAVAVTVAVSYWVLAALNTYVDRPPTSSRYQYASAVFILLIVAEALRGRRIGARALAVAGAVSAAAIVGGITLMHREYTRLWRPYSDQLRSQLGAIQIAGRSALPSYVFSFGATQASASSYLARVAADGSPAFGESELLRQSELDREIADTTNAQALGIQLGPRSAVGPVVGCQTLQATTAGLTPVTLLRGSFTLRNLGGSEVGVRLGRFSDDLPVDFGSLAPGSIASLAIPSDNSTRPWRLGLVGSDPVRLCTTAPGGRS